MLDGIGDVPNDSSRLERRQRAFGKMVGKTASLDECHTQEILPVPAAEVVHRHDAGMIKPGGGTGFNLKPLHSHFRFDVTGVDQLDGNESVQFDVACLPDHRRAAAA